MAVTGTQAPFIWVPIPGVERRQGGPVGTVSADAGANGDSSGGTVTCEISIANVVDFGFEALVLPTIVALEDTLSTAIPIRIGVSSANRRIGGGNDIRFVVTPVRVVSMQTGFISGPLPAMSINGPAQTTVLRALWETNENGVSYHLHVYGVVYNETEMARAVDELMIDGPLTGLG